MTEQSYCATHNTYPLPNEPCWQCANPFIIKETDKVADLLEALSDLVILIDVRYQEIKTSHALALAKQAIRKATE